MRLILKLLSCIIICVLITGCWDHIEMEDRGYVIGIAIDKAPDIPKGYESEEEYLSERDLERMPLQVGKPKYAYTIQIPIIAKAQSLPLGRGGGGEGERTWDLTMFGNSYGEVSRQYSTRTNYVPFYSHIQTIVISEEVARDGLLPPMDILLRDPEMRRRTRIFITPGEAKAILDVKPRIDDYPSFYLADLPLNASKTARILHKIDLGEISEHLHGGHAFIVPRVVHTKDEVKSAGAAVFKDERMIGWLGELDTIYVEWVKDLVLGGMLTFPAPGDKEGIIALEAVKVKTDVRPVVNGENIKISIKSKATFNLEEQFNVHSHDSYNVDYIKAVEDIMKKTLEERILDTVKYVQKEFEADIFYFHLALERYKPQVWERVKDNWDELFPKVEVEVDIDPRIEHTGTTR